MTEQETFIIFLEDAVGRINALVLHDREAVGALESRKEEEQRVVIQQLSALAVKNYGSMSQIARRILGFLLDQYPCFANESLVLVTRAATKDGNPYKKAAFRAISMIVGKCPFVKNEELEKIIINAKNEDIIKAARWAKKVFEGKGRPEKPDALKRDEMIVLKNFIKTQNEQLYGKCPKTLRHWAKFIKCRYS